MRTDERIEEIDPLPVEDRTVVSECVIQPLQTTGSDIDQQWADLASQRWQDMQSDRITSIDSDEVFQEIWSRVS